MTPSRLVAALAAGVAAPGLALADDRPLALPAAIPPPPPATAEAAPPPAGATPERALKPVAIGVDLVPMVGTSAAYRGGDRRDLSVGIVSWAGGVDGFSASAAGSLVQEDLDGFDASGGISLVGGRMDGFQVAGGLVGAGGGADGFQAAGGATYAGGDLDGFQAAGGGNVAMGAVDGFQAAGGVNYAHDRMDGMQLAGGLNVAGDVDGLQLATANIARGRVDGLQLGIVNIARSSQASIGLVNLIWEGRTHIDVWGDEAGFGTVAVKHGSDWFHNYFGASYRPDAACSEWALLYGLGAHGALTHRWFLEGDLLYRHVSPTAGFLVATNELVTARGQLGWQIFKNVAVTGGLSWNTYISTVTDGSHYVGGAGASAERGAVVVRNWPGATLGVQLLPQPRDKR